MQLPEEQLYTSSIRVLSCAIDFPEKKCHDTWLCRTSRMPQTPLAVRSGHLGQPTLGSFKARTFPGGAVSVKHFCHPWVIPVSLRILKLLGVIISCLICLMMSLPSNKHASKNSKNESLPSPGGLQLRPRGLRFSAWILTASWGSSSAHANASKSYTYWLKQWWSSGVCEQKFHADSPESATRRAKAWTLTGKMSCLFLGHLENAKEAFLSRW